MQLNPYLNFDGQCEAAFRWYAEVLGGTITDLNTFRGTPAAEHVPADMQDKVMHASMKIGAGVLMGSDSPPGHHEPPQGTYVALHVEAAAEGKRLFDALAAGGTIRMPFEKTFWSEGFGMLVDRYGTPWMINCAPAT
jgi:PhnB protein